MPPTSLPNFQIKQGSQRPAIRSTILEAIGGASPVPMDLTGATIEFRMSAEIGQAPVFQSAGAIVNPPGTDGIVKYEWGETDTAVPGAYYAEWVITITDDIEAKIIVPTVGYIVVLVLPSLEA